MNSIVAGPYPAAGITLGLCLTFGYLAARHIAQKETDGAVRKMPQCR
jgi:hypothetical protein